MLHLKNTFKRTLNPYKWILPIRQSTNIKERDMLAQRKLPVYGAQLDKIPEKVKLTMATPYKAFYEGEEIDDVIITTTEGILSLAPRHIPAVEELIPGVIKVTSGNKTKTFVSGNGYCIFHDDSSCELMCPEILDVEDVDIDRLEKFEKEAEAKANLEGDEGKHAKIEMEIYNLLKCAINT